MWLTDVSIRRPVFIIMVVLALIILGLQSKSRMSAELTPKIDFPYISIVTVYPGAGPQEIETLVSKPIEDAVGSISNLKNITSTSQDGLSIIGMEFELGTSVDTAAADVRDKISAARGDLPKDVNDPIITKADIAGDPVMTFAVNGPMPSRELRDYADKTLKDKFSKVSGVAAVNVSGGDVREVSIAIDRDRLEAYGLSIGQVAAAMSAENLNLPAGSIKEGPGGSAYRDYAVRTVGEFKSAEEIENVKLTIPGMNGPSPGTVRLGDIADVKDTIQEPTLYSRLGGKDTVILAVQKQSDANTVEVAKGVKEELKQLQGYTEQSGKKIPGQLPPGVKLTTTTDQSVFVQDALDDVNKALFEGIILVVLIVFLFLHSGRATFIVALAIPTSLVATFLPMSAFGFTLNMMTLLALSLSVGILVDDSIVVLENIERHIRKGERPKEASLNGRSEIGLAAVTITLVDVVVFVPIAFMGGIVGQFFRSFGITVAIATLFSLFMSFTLTPMLASKFLKSREQEDADESRPKGFVGGMFQRFEAFYAMLDAQYRGVLRWAIENRAFTIVIGVVALLVVIGMMKMVPLPGRIGIAAIALAYSVLATVHEDYKALATKLGAPFIVGLMLLVLEAITTKIAPPVAVVVGPLMMLTGVLTGVALAIAVIGGFVCLFLRGSEARRAGIGYALAVMVILAFVKFPMNFDFIPQVDRGEFAVSVELPAGSGLDATDNVTRQVEQVVSKIKGIEYYQSTVGAASAGQFGGGSSGSQYARVSVKLKDRGKERPEPVEDVMTEVNNQTALIPGAEIIVQQSGNEGPGGKPIQMEVTGSNFDEIQQVSNQLVDKMKSVPGALDVKSSWQVGKPELQIAVDRQKAADLGVSVAQIGTALRTSIEGNTDAKLRDKGDEYDIRVRLAKADRQGTADVSDVVVGHSNGVPIYLRDVADVNLSAAPNKIDRKNRQRLITVGANVAEGYGLQNVQMAVDNAIKDVPRGGTTIKPGGSAQMSGESNQYMGQALALAIILVYMLMAALFESVITPLIIMFSLPQALVGAMLALMLTGKSLSIISMIGIIMLVGLVTKNAILLIDYTNTLRERGMKRTDAVLEAGPTRLRPILMTTLAMIGGMMPTALALSKGSEQRAPMAIAVIGGLILSTLLTLLVIPTAYTIVDDIVIGVKKRLGIMRETEYNPIAEPAPSHNGEHDPYEMSVD